MRKLIALNFIMIILSLTISSCNKKEEFADEEFENNLEATETQSQNIQDSSSNVSNEINNDESQDQELEKTDNNSEQSNVEASQKLLEEKANANLERLRQEVFYIRDNDIVMGDPNAKVILFEYSSLTCPSCAYFQRAVFPELKRLYIDTGKVAYVTREFPFDKQAFDAATLARCAGTDKYHSFKEILFQQQNNWAFKKNYREILNRIATLGGVSTEKFEECLKDEETTAPILRNYQDAAQKLQLNVTPVFYVNGIRHKGSYSLESLSKSLEDQLSK